MAHLSSQVAINDQVRSFLKGPSWFSTIAHRFAILMNFQRIDCVVDSEDVPPIRAYFLKGTVDEKTGPALCRLCERFHHDPLVFLNPTIPF